MTPRRKAESAEEYATRVLPHDLAAEKAVLGAVLLNSSTFERAAGIVTPEDFFRRAHRAIFEAMRTLLDEQRGTVDLMTLKSELQRRGELDEAGGPAYLSALMDGVPRSSNVQHYAAIVKDRSSLRGVIYAANEMLADAYHDDARASEIINAADKAIIALQRGSTPGRLLKLGDTAGELYADLEYRAQHKGELSGIDTGFTSINDLTLGWQAGDLIVGAARPSIGKTAFVLNTAIAAARLGKQVAIFSLEMRRRQLEFRMLSHLAGVDLTRIMGGYLGEGDYEKLSPALAAMHELPIFIDDRGGQTSWDIRSACRRLKAEGGLDLVIVDYVQLIPGTLERRGATRNEEVTDISRRMKALADEVSAPILLLSQLSRASDARDDKRPRLSDLRESGALEQDADIVWFLHRKNHRESGTTNFILDKQRNGPAGTVNLTITRETQTFTDGGEDPVPPPAEPASEEHTKTPKGYGGRKRRH